MNARAPKTMASDSSVWHPYTRHSAIEAGLPMMVRGEGPYLFDIEGRRYVDAVASWWCSALGHGHPRIVEAIQAQAAKLQHSILGNLSHPCAAELAGALNDWLPGPRRVHFASDGASAVEAALKIALQFHYQNGRPERTEFISLRSAYHGDTLGTLALGYLETFHRSYQGVLRRSVQIPVPPYDESEESCRAVAQETFEQCAGRAAALVVEPMCQGAAGIRIYSASFLRHLGALCKAHDVLLIADEIAMGFGRTGKDFAFQHADLDPDLVCVGKALSAGALPISAVAVKASIYAAFSDTPDDHTFYHGHTFAGNPIAAAASIAALKVYREENLSARAAALEGVLEEELGVLRNHLRVADVRTLGLIGAVECAVTASAEGRPPLPVRVQQAMRERGILVRPLGRVLYLMPPLIIDESLLRDICRALVDTIGSA